MSHRGSAFFDIREKGTHNFPEKTYVVKIPLRFQYAVL